MNCALETGVRAISVVFTGIRRERPEKTGIDGISLMWTIPQLLPELMTSPPLFRQFPVKRPSRDFPLSRWT